MRAAQNNISKIFLHFRFFSTKRFFVILIIYDFVYVKLFLQG